METTDRMLDRDAALGPGRLGLDAGHTDDRKPHPVGIAEGQHGFAEALHRHVMGHAVLDEAMGPVADRALRHAEDRLLRLADTEAALSRMLPGEEGQDRARRRGGITVIEVIGARIVEIDGLLDEAQAEHAAIELEIAAGRTGDRRDVMNAVDLHGGGPFEPGRRPVAAEIGPTAPKSQRNTIAHSQCRH